MPIKGKTYTHIGLTMTLSEWAKYLDVPKNTLDKRLRRGFSLDEVFSEEKLPLGRRSPHNIPGYKTIRDAAKDADLNDVTIHRRLKRGLSIDEAMAHRDAYRGMRIIEYKGLRLNIMQWSRFLGIHHATIRRRLKRGFPLDVVFLKTDLRNPRELRIPRAAWKQHRRCKRDIKATSGGGSRLSEGHGDRRGEHNARDAEIGVFQS